MNGTPVNDSARSLPPDPHDPSARSLYLFYATLFPLSHSFTSLSVRTRIVVYRNLLFLSHSLVLPRPKSRQSERTVRNSHADFLVSLTCEPVSSHTFPVYL